jgi:hypothetical protein
LAKSCISLVPIENKSHIQVVDSTGSEFWYSTENHVFTPGFAVKKWTQKKIAETFNNSENAKDTLQGYSMKSLSNKRLGKIIYDTCVTEVITLKPSSGPRLNGSPATNPGFLE